MLNLITDRTQTDVTMDTALGQYNYTDLNRVESAVSELMTRLNATGYNISLDIKTDWHLPSEASDVQDTPTMAEMERYRGNISTIRSALAVFSETPDMPESMRYLTVERANDLEKILLCVERALDNMVHTVDFAWACGAAHTGIYLGLG